MDPSAASLHAALQELLPSEASGLVVALSGGTDSAALLCALKAIPELSPLSLRAVHVDHGLQAAAAELRAACESLCQRLGVPLEVLTVEVPRTRGVSLEAAARTARYAALADALQAGECLLTAHHAEDQAETLLLQSLRGAGLKGLAAMPPLRTLGRGWHARPVLGATRAKLHQLGRALPADSREDPMNAELRFDRNYLRHEVWPRLSARWPSAAESLARTARLLAEAQQLLELSQHKLFARLQDGEGLSIPGLRALEPAQRSAAVRLWLATRALEAPSQARLSEALRQLLEADASHLPVVVFGEHALRRYRERMLVTPATLPALPAAPPLAVQVGASVELGALGTLRIVEVHGGLDPNRLPKELVVRARSGGEMIHVGGHSRTVQHLCQQMGVLPWLRDALPFLFAGDELLAVADLWLDERWCVARQASGWGFVWQDGPIIV